MSPFSSDYGDKENDDLKERFGIKKDDYPEYRLFVGGKGEPEVYLGDEGKSEDIVKFVAEKTGRSRAVVSMFFGPDVDVDVNVLINK